MNNFLLIIFGFVIRLYPSCPWDDKIVRKLILERKIAPRYPGSEVTCIDTQECPICFMVGLHKRTKHTYTKTVCFLMYMCSFIQVV